MSTGLIDIMKRAALDMTESHQFCDIRFGTVTSTSPLEIQTTSQFPIPEVLLVVPEKLTDYTVKVSFNWDSEEAGSHNHDYSGNTQSSGGGSGEEAFESHSHSYEGTTATTPNHKHVIKSEKTKEITIHNALQVGDEVVLIRKTGGQTFYVLDRLPKEIR